MFAYAVRRILQFIPTILAVTFIIFLLLNVLPGNAALMAAGEQDHNIDAHYIEQMKKDWGLDKPVWLRFVIYVKDLSTGNLGLSFLRREPVGQLLLDRLWPTLKLALVAMGIAIFFGVPLGFLFSIAARQLDRHLQHDGCRVRGIDPPVLAGTFADVFYFRQIAPPAAHGIWRRVSEEYHHAGLYFRSCLHGAIGQNHPGGGGGDFNQ